MTVLLHFQVASQVKDLQGLRPKLGIQGWEVWGRLAVTVLAYGGTHSQSRSGPAGLGQVRTKAGELPPFPAGLGL